MIRPGSRAAWLAVVIVGMLAAPAWAQLTLPPGSPVIPPGAEAAAPRRAPLTITPTISVIGEYNDNVFQSADNKVSDFILGIAPGISIALESPIYRLIGSYSFTAEIYAEQDQLNDAFAQHNLTLDGSYRVTPLLTLSLTDTLIVANDSNAVAVENVSTGRTSSFANTLSPAAAYQLDPRTTLRTRGTWVALRFEDDVALDSDAYAVEAFADYAFTPRLIGSAGYQFAFIDIEDSPWVTTHTPRVGVTYRFTETLTGALNGGPTFQVPEDGDTEVFPAITASLQQRFRWGAATVQYDHAVGTAGGLGGTTENQSLGAVVQADRLMRGLVVQFAPRYSRSTSTVGEAIEVDSFSLTVQARYELTRYVALIGGYTYFLQRSDSVVVTGAGVATADDIDQNRLFVGLQFGYPITVD